MESIKLFIQEHVAFKKQLVVLARADVVKSAPATATRRFACTSCPISIPPAMCVAAHATIGRRSRCASKVRP